MSIMVKLRENKNFSANEKIVAKYILENFDNIKNIDAKLISKKTFVSLATVTRMSKRLECSGFRELKMLLIEEKAKLEKTDIKTSGLKIDIKDDVNEIIEKINSISIESLRETKLLQNKETLVKVSELLKQKDIIDFYGMGASYIVCLDAEYKFLRSGKQTNTFDSYDKQYIQAKNSNKNHLAIIISYSGQTPEMIEIANILKEKNIDTVSITRITANDVAKRCKYNLYVTSKEELERVAAIYSRISMLNLIDILYIIYYNNNYEVVLNNINNTKLKKNIFNKGE